MFNRKEYDKQYRKKHKKRIRENSKKYAKEHKEQRKEWQKERNERRRIDILNVISNNNPHCIRCGCDDIRFLEINHKNGGGNKERQKQSINKFYRSIYNGRIDDLELLCKVCNAQHYLELKYGKEFEYKISFRREE